MDAGTRHAIERATQRARKLLEEDFYTQLEGTFAVLRDGSVAPAGGGQRSARKALQRDEIVAALERKRATGLTAAEAVADYVRDSAFATLIRFVALKMLEVRELLRESLDKGAQSAGYHDFIGMTSVLWPRRLTLASLLAILNASELLGVWGAEETLGWVYQFFNGADERRAMRGASQAPRTSRELAVRNQFFTPRYVVEFLTDNTLGRIWYEMRAGQTSLAARCQYLIKRTDEKYPPRAKKDPRDLRILDPACGSGHLLLYAFDLLLTIYEEAHGDADGPGCAATGRTLAADFPSLTALRRALPALVLAHNLHGVDIDPRCVHIAQLAVWMRAQRAYRDFGIKGAERPPIRRSNIVVAEPLVGGDEELKDFLAKLDDVALGRRFKELADSLKLAGDLGLLLRTDSSLALRELLVTFLSTASLQASTRRRLFAEDAAQGVGLLETAEKRFDVVLMNPPFGRASTGGKAYLDAHYGRAKSDIYAAFVERGVELVVDGGRVGALTSRQALFSSFLEDWRTALLFGDSHLTALADLGHGVLDDALVEAAAYVLEKGHGTGVFWATGLLQSKTKSADLRHSVASAHAKHWHDRARLKLLPGAPVAYGVPDSFLTATFAHPSLAESVAEARWGLQADDNFRFVRLAWEVAPQGDGTAWVPLAKGGEYALFYDDIHLVIRWAAEARELRAFIESRYSWTKRASSADLYGRPGLTYPERTTSELSLRALPAGCIFNIAGPAITIDDPTLRLALLALSYTRVFRALVEVLIGGGDAVASGSAARHYKAGILNRLPVPNLDTPEGKQLARIGERSLATAYRLAAQDETGRVFAGISLGTSFAEHLGRQLHNYEEGLLDLEKQSQLADELALALYGVDDLGRAFVRETYGPHSSAGAGSARPERIAAMFELSADALVDQVASEIGYRRQVTKHAYFTDRRYELIALAEDTSVHSVVQTRRVLGLVPKEDQISAAKSVLSWLFGVGVGRWRSRPQPGRCDPFERLPAVPPALRLDPDENRLRAIAVDDAGTPDDIEAIICTACAEAGWDPSQAVAAAAVAGATDVRGYFAHAFFADHLARYSRSRRKAPIYWQLATPSASYSIWLYLHGLTNDTFYKVQKDYVAAKLTQEERKLAAQRRQFGGRPKAADRKALAAQEAFVEELRAFLEEVTRVAPLWNPNLDDGVVLTAALLWRLVPHCKPWQKELRATWDALCAGEYDWAHVAMHLWPERVIPKCAADRSLAIAHGLEANFWAASSDEKWRARAVPTRSIEELVRQRTSSAVKAALKVLAVEPRRHT